EIVVEDWQIVSGQILDQDVQQVEDGVISKVCGKLATGQCNGFKNAAKSRVVSTPTLYKPYLVQTHDVTHKAKTRDQLLKHILKDKKLMEAKFETQLIAWCTNDGPNGKKMQQLLQDFFDWLIVILCWAHQIDLVVGDFLVIQQTVTKDINHALEVTKWFNNHGTALALLQTGQFLTFEGLFWALILPAITRLTAHYCSILTNLPRYLKLKQPLQICCTQNEDRLIICARLGRNYRRRQGIFVHWFGMSCFGIDWETAIRIQKILKPLAITANVAQASHTHLNHVLLMLGNLACIFTQNLKYDKDLCFGILKSLEKP
ncbi:ribonuclease H-like domain-containing protein, partial [Crassisporium funariophilum]